MSKPSKSGRSGAKHHHKRKGQQATAASTASADIGLFVGLALIGAFGVFLLVLMTEMPWTSGLLGFVMVMAFLINLSAAQAVGGETDLGWRKGLARLPLRFAGYGARGGKPIEAAKGSERAKAIVFVSIAISVIIVAAMSYWAFQ